MDWGKNMSKVFRVTSDRQRDRKRENPYLCLVFQLMSGRLAKTRQM